MQSFTGMSTANWACQHESSPHAQKGKVQAIHIQRLTLKLTEAQIYNRHSPHDTYVFSSRLLSQLSLHCD